MRHSVLSLWLILFSGLGLGMEEPFQVEHFVDRTSAGWAYKINDEAFEVSVPGCRIRWNAVENQDASRRLVLAKDCALDFAAQVPLHQAILQTIDRRWPIRSFTGFEFGPYGLGSETDWVIPIAVASARSPEYRDYRLRYPATKHHPNQIFVRLARETGAYRPLQDLFSSYGVRVELTSVEKVFARKVGELPFRRKLLDLGLRDRDMVLYGAGSSSFAIECSGLSGRRLPRY